MDGGLTVEHRPSGFVMLKKDVGAPGIGIY